VPTGRADNYRVECGELAVLLVRVGYRPQSPDENPLWIEFRPTAARKIELAALPSRGRLRGRKPYDKWH